MNNIRLFHISHTDLDGYACQFLTNEVFSKKHFYNANYGLEVKQAIKQAVLPSRDLPAYILCFPNAFPKRAATASPKARYKKLAKTKVLFSNKNMVKKAPASVHGKPLILCSSDFLCTPPNIFKINTLNFSFLLLMYSPANTIAIAARSPDKINVLGKYQNAIT